MRYIVLLAIIASHIGSVHAQSKYEASTVPKDLLPYASAVVRNMEERTEVKELNNVIYYKKIAVTILNKNGDDHAEITVPYDKSSRIRYIKGTVYDEYGKPQSKFSEKNFSDHSYADGVSMFNDTRLKYFQPASVSYPYTVEYEVETTYKQSLNLDSWMPNPYVGTSVEHSSYQFICKPDFNLHYKALNYTGELIEATNAAGLKTYTWEIKNLKAFRSEPYSPDYRQFATQVIFAPEKFYYEGYTGSFNNWNQMGKWYYDNLLKTRTQLSPETVSYIRSLTDTISDPKLKAKAIYEYMQRKTRYISIQVGIGGFQPFLASEVDRLSYGDCKALVNYTQSLLKAANIDSYYCVVEAGSAKKSLLTDFASMAQGNHIILCMPFKNDTTWLECTSQKIPFGFLSSFTDDRWVLACTPDGGKLMHTPKYTAEQNRQVRTATLTLNEAGELTGSITTVFEGTQYDNRNDDVKDDKEDEKNIKDIYPINNMEIETLNYTRQKNIQPVNKELIKFSARDYATLSADKYFFQINLANRLNRPPREVRNRTTDVYINRGYTDIDEIVYTVPQGYKMGTEPLNIEINKPFGKFKAIAVMTGNNQIIYKRQLQLLDGTYPKDMYQELVSFYQAVADADTYNVGLVKRN